MILLRLGLTQIINIMMKCFGIVLTLCQIVANHKARKARTTAACGILLFAIDGTIFFGFFLLLFLSSYVSNKDGKVHI